MDLPTMRALLADVEEMYRYVTQPARSYEKTGSNAKPVWVREYHHTPHFYNEVTRRGRNALDTLRTAINRAEYVPMTTTQRMEIIAAWSDLMDEADNNLDRAIRVFAVARGIVTEDQADEAIAFVFDLDNQEQGVVDRLCNAMNSDIRKQRQGRAVH